MNRHQRQLIIDNPNLSSTALGLFLGLNRTTIARFRDCQLWKHNGRSIPYLTRVMTNDGYYFQIEAARRALFRGQLIPAMDCLDRLIFCLENNNGKLPPTRLGGLHDDLGFVK